jgi:hypothetical protein
MTDEITDRTIALIFFVTALAFPMLFYTVIRSTFEGYFLLTVGVLVFMLLYAEYRKKQQEEHTGETLKEKLRQIYEL